MKSKILIYMMLMIFKIGFGFECSPPLEKYFVKFTTFKMSDQLLVSGNPLDTIVNKFEKMDTANCFEFKLANGQKEFGKLIKTSGFGLQKFEYRIKKATASITVENLVEVTEYRADPKKYEKNIKESKQENTNTVANALSIVGASVLIVGLLIWIAGSIGPMYHII
jgi:hypothetical protein